MHLEEKQLSSERIYDGKVVCLRKDAVELENGGTAFREVVEHHGGVCVAALTPENEIYFVRQFRYPMGKAILEIPAGKLEQGENPLECGIRELKEEIGAKASEIIDLGEMYPSPGYSAEHIYCYLAKKLSFSEQKLDEDEFLDVVKLPLEKAIEMILSGEIPDAKTQVAVMKVKLLSESGRI